MCQEGSAHTQVLQVCCTYHLHVARCASVLHTAAKMTLLKSVSTQPHTVTNAVLLQPHTHTHVGLPLWRNYIQLAATIALATFNMRSAEYVRMCVCVSVCIQQLQLQI